MKKLSVEHCLELEGHHWKYFYGHVGKISGCKSEAVFSGEVVLSGYDDENSNAFRSCPVCGLIELRVPEKWVECNFEKRQELCD